jgi:hypothetical protein
MESSRSARRFKPPWTLIRENSECYTVQDADGVTVAWLYCRDDSQRYSFGASKLTSGEARRIGKAISRIPEFMMQRQGFYPRGNGPRVRADRPYHVALQDNYIRAHWDEISALCRLNSLPFNLTGETIPSRVMGCGGFTSSRGRWTPSCSGIASRGGGCAAQSFTIPSGRPICRP